MSTEYVDRGIISTTSEDGEISPIRSEIEECNSLFLQRRTPPLRCRLGFLVLLVELPDGFDDV